MTPREEAERLVHFCRDHKSTIAQRNAIEQTLTQAVAHGRTEGAAMEAMLGPRDVRQAQAMGELRGLFDGLRIAIEAVNELEPAGLDGKTLADAVAAIKARVPRETP